MDQPQLRKEDRHRAEQPLAAAQTQTRAAPGRPASRLQSSIHRGGCGSGRIHLHCQPREASRRLPGEAEPWAKPSAGAGGGGSAVRAGSHTAESLPAPGAPTGGRPSRCKALGPPATQKKSEKKKEKHLAPTTPTRGRGGLEGALEGRGAKPTLPAPKPSREGRCSRQAAPQSKPRPGHAHRAPTGQAGRAGRSPTPPRPQRGPTEGQSPALIYGPPPMLYGFLNSAPATINVVNAEIISIFWCQAVIYSSHFSGGGSHAVKSSALPIKC